LHEGEPARQFFVQLTGVTGVFLADPNGGDDLLAKLFVAPACFGEIEMLARIPHLEYVEVFSPAEVVAIPRDAYDEVLRQVPGAAYALVLDLAKRMCASIYNAKASTFHSVEERI